MITKRKAIADTVKNVKLKTTNINSIGSIVISKADAVNQIPRRFCARGGNGGPDSKGGGDIKLQLSKNADIK